MGYRIEKINLKNGKTIERKTATSVSSVQFQSRMRKEKLKKRTPGEEWAHEEIAKRFGPSEYSSEYIFKYRRFDFFFFRTKIALEIDGGYHSTNEQRMIDESLDAKVLSENGITVLRVRNFDQLGLHLALRTVAQGLKACGPNPRGPSYETPRGKKRKKREMQLIERLDACANRPFVPKVIVRRKAFSGER